MNGSSTEQVTVAADQAGERIDRVLAAATAHSRTRIKALILDGAVAIGTRTIRDPGQRVNSGEQVTIVVPEAVDPVPAGEAIPLNIRFEDDQIVVLEKPSGLVVHPAPGHSSGTLVNALIAHCGDSLSGIGGVKRPGIVHRLDRDTTGLMVAAKTDAAHRALADQFADHGRTGPLRRGYQAFIWGVPDRVRGTIDAPLDRDPRNREKIAVRGSGREAITHWEISERYTGADGKLVASLVSCQLETGRTHQIRVHMAHIGHPLLGDPLYAGGFRTKATRLPDAAKAALADLGRQALHAYLLVIEHPTSGERLEFQSELPADLARLRRALAAGP